jgi:3-isopropylmalate/(R)-2-methylmalate dehydratase small subunit
MLNNIVGRVAYVFDQPNYDVDQIVGVENIRVQNVYELTRIVMAAYEPGFASNVQPGDVLVGGENFGYGHPHYPPMTVMRHLGIAAVIAESFSPGYWWGEMAGGFPQITCPGILSLASRWDEVEIDWSSERVISRAIGASLPFEPFGEAERSVLKAGGLLQYLKGQAAPTSPVVAPRVQYNPGTEK